MSITLIPILLLISGVTAIGSIIGIVFLAFSMLKSSKKYQAYILELKQRGKYQEWIERNKGQRLFLKIAIGFAVLFLLAFLVTFVKEFITVPSTVLMLTRVLIYLFYPYTFIAVLIAYGLHRKALKDLSKEIDTPKASLN
jgi:hypothetical protein